METKAHYLLIGLFSLAGFLGILVFVLWFARLQLDRQFTYYDVYFDEVSGLGLSSDVRFAGLSVGRVVDMQFSDRDDGAIRVRLEVGEDTPIRADSTAGRVPQGVTGTFAVAITAGTPESPLLRDLARAGVPEIPASRSVLQTLSDRGPEIVNRLGQIAEDLSELLGEENRARVAGILANIERSSANLDRTMADVSEATGAIAGAAGHIAGFGDQIGGLGEAATGTLGRVDAAIDRLGQSVDKADALMTAGTRTMTGVESYVTGELTALTTRLDGTATRLEASLGEADETLRVGRDALAATSGTMAAAGRVIDSDVAPLAADLHRTLGHLDSAIGQLSAELPGISTELAAAARSANAAFTSLETMVTGLKAPLGAFATTGLPAFTRVAGDLRGLIDNMNALVSALRRNPSQILSAPRQPEFRR